MITGLLFSMLALSGCQSVPAESMARDGAAYELIDSQEEAVDPIYRIGPFDVLTISVFNEPSLSFQSIPVDAAGQFDYPLIGTLVVEGMTVSELTQEIKTRLDAEYYRDSRVTVFVTSSASQFVVVEGQVQEPGRYELPQGRASLLEVIALAKSPTNTAKMDQIMVFREIKGERFGAVFNLADIRRGAVDDPLLRGGDVVVVGYSSLKGAFRDFLTTAPFFNVFTRF